MTDPFTVPMSHGPAQIKSPFRKRDSVFSLNNCVYTEWPYFLLLASFGETTTHILSTFCLLACPIGCPRRSAIHTYKSCSCEKDVAGHNQPTSGEQRLVRSNLGLMEKPSESQSDRDKQQAHADPEDLHKDEIGSAEGSASPDFVPQSSSRQPFTSRSQVDADLALARALQQQERAYMLLHMNNEGSEYDTSGSGSCDYEEYVNDGDEVSRFEYEAEDDASELPSEQPPLESGLSLSSQEEIDGSLYENDEAFARALQEAEDREATAQMMALAGIHELEGDDEDASNDSQDVWQDVDPDNMSYEELVALGEAVGTQSRGLTPDLISALPYSKYVQEKGASTSSSDPCVICRLDYEDGDFLSTLPCKHQYHADCIKNWLQINKICPVCSAEVTS